MREGQFDLLVLATLARDEGHGFAIIERIREASDGTFDLAEGTVYPLLHRLEREGLVASAENVVSGRRRRVYRLTQSGRARTANRRAEWSAFRNAIDRVVARGVGAEGATA